MKRKREKVLVCMSGGVDSSVAAALLVREGYDVTGGFMKQWEGGKDVESVCTWKQDRRDALRVAARLRIPLITLDFTKEYKVWVMDYMFKEYESGRTPNPDVLCNKYIKFGFWLKKAKELGFDKLATGHYAKIKKIRKQENKKAGYELGVAKDTDKDQTYFLHQLNQEQLAHTLFPLGDFLKSEVRSLAHKFDLPTAEREESMGICFVGEVPMKEFLQMRISQKPGKIVMSSGEVVGEHEGLAFYTMGQRHLSLNRQIVKSLNQTESRPLYVVDKNFEMNELVVGYEDDILLYKKMIVASNVNWIIGQVPELSLKCKVRLRHRGVLVKAKVRKVGEKVKVEFSSPQRAVTPGQFAVFYKDDVCLGGGVIN